MSETPALSTSDVEAGFEKSKDIDIEGGAQEKSEDVEAVAINTNPREGMTLWRWILVLVGLYMGAILYGKYSMSIVLLNGNDANLLAGLDTTIAADVQAEVYESLGDIQNLPWVGLGFPMASVASILLFGRAYGLFNIKVLLLSSIFVFEVGSALCGAAPTSDALIVGRVIAGLGGAGMYLGSVTSCRKTMLFTVLTSIQCIDLHICLFNTKGSCFI